MTINKLTEQEKLALDGLAGIPVDLDLTTQEGREKAAIYNQGVLAQPNRESLLDQDLARPITRFDTEQTGLEYTTAAKITDVVLAAGLAYGVLSSLL
jgi:hypothetical protein